MHEQKRVRVDTAPLGVGSAIVDPAARVWPWYLAGTLMLAAAAWVGSSDTGAVVPVAAIRGQALARVELQAELGVAVAGARSETTTRAGASETMTSASAEPIAAAEPARDVLTAKSLNSLGYAARKRGDHASAKTLYREAMAVDATHVWSRYNLACELALEGDQQGALRLLEAIDRLGGPDADDALGSHAPKDKDLRGLRNHSRFLAMTRRHR